DRICFSEPVIDRRAQGVQRNLSLAIPFRARNFSSVEPTRTAQPNSFCAKVYRSLHGFLHGTAIGNPPLDLQRYIFCDELSVEFWRLDFLDIDLDLFALGHFRNFFRHLFDLSALSSDYDPRPRGVNGHANGIPRPLDHNLRDGCELQFFLYVITNLQV